WLRWKQSCAETTLIPHRRKQKAVRKDCGSSPTTSPFWVRNLSFMDPTKARHQTPPAYTGREEHIHGERWEKGEQRRRLQKWSSPKRRNGRGKHKVTSRIATAKTTQDDENKKS
ncbi:unnamed protein product, partial [Sphacelaria rigidula]